LQDNPQKVATSTALAAGFSCIISGLLSNLPFVLAPTTSTSLYFSLAIQNQKMDLSAGNSAVFLLGIFFFFCGIRFIALRLIISNFIVILF
jgi:xanthine/uracil/vitamin C permease (AzgA family)